ncbi:hypothetical protein C1J05_10355 [Sulfitobacter sp. JL08]|nr:hypothetical protein C1J05_10355 [Sulfitobacter sp. JL08]
MNSTSSQIDPRIKRKACHETSDTYGAIVAVLDHKHRVIVCKDGIQWITQRRKSGGADRPWRGLGYYTNRKALIRACALLECEIEPAVMSLLAELPDTIGRTA